MLGLKPMNFLEIYMNLLCLLSREDMMVIKSHWNVYQNWKEILSIHKKMGPKRTWN